MDGKLQVNDLLAIIGKEGEDVSALLLNIRGGNEAASEEGNRCRSMQPKKLPKHAAAPEAATEKEQQPAPSSKAMQLRLIF